MNKKPERQIAENVSTFGYISLKGEDGHLSVGNNKELQKSFDKLGVATNTSLAHAYSLQNILPGISARQPFDRYDYEYFRPGEAIPRKYDDIIKSCDAVYISNGLIRYVIDLMSDFACQGIKLSHPVKAEQKFYQDWFKKVNGPERSERFLSYLYRHNMVTVITSNAKISSKLAFAHREASWLDTKTDVKRSYDLPDADVKLEKDKVYKGVLPIQFTFLHPCFVHPKSALEALKQRPSYVYKPPFNNSLGINNKEIDLDPTRTCVYFYKKDDWQIKPVPFLFPLIQHAIMIDKLNLADSAALDGATSRVRIFKLGDLDKMIFPDDAAISKLENILLSNTGGGPIDLIWSPDIDILESKVDISTFLGKEKFAPHLEQLYVGLGVPPTLIGIGTGATNNLISLKTFIQRLVYGRQQLVHFWEKQIRHVQKAIGFSKPAIIEFDFTDLGEEAAQRKLLMDMADRNIISDERLLELLGHDADMEKIRVNREERERRSDRRAPKTSPWHDPQFEISLRKIALQRGYISANQADVEIDQEFKDEVTPFEQQMEMMNMKNSQSKVKEDKNAGLPGRPTGIKDSEQRKKPQFNPKIKAAREVWSSDAYKKISEILKPVFFDVVSKSNLRQLTSSEIDSFEKIKFTVLCGFEPFSDITKEEVQKYVTNENKENNKNYKTTAKVIQKTLGRELTLDELRQIQLFIYNNEVYV